MGKDEKRLCKWGKGAIEKSFDEYAGIVSDARFVCLKCGRAANKKKFLCKPKAIKTSS